MPILNRCIFYGLWIIVWSLVMPTPQWRHEYEIPRGEERVKRGGDFRFMALGVSFGFNHLVATGTWLGKKEERLLKG